MVTTLREAKARFSEMVKRASRGEEVVITVHGKETAKLVAVPKRNKKIDKEKWLRELDKLREEIGQADTERALRKYRTKIAQIDFNRWLSGTLLRWSSFMCVSVIPTIFGK
jgi:prevent-host-death family protein